MERTHPRDMRLPAAMAFARDAAAVTDATTSTSASGSLLKRTTARIARSLLNRRCVTSESQDTCEKPVASTDTVVGVLIGVGVLIFVIVMCVLLYLHIRRTRADKAELENDPHELSDYGIDEPATKKGGKSNLDIPTTQQKRLSAQDLLEAQNPFGYGAELADSDRVSVSTPGRKSSPPRHTEPDMKM